MNTIKPKDLKTIIGYQESCSKKSPVTMRATFKLSSLEELIKAIKDCPGFEEDNLKKHNICITFVREKTDAQGAFKSHFTHISQNGIIQIKASEKSKYGYTQVIPIISGCISELDANFQNNKFTYLRNKDGVIPFLRPGGEGSGLIPPPPTGGDDSFS